ncbi:NAD(P)H:quinone oxidoreductase [Oleispirillum naphthae]|uniref:NAD(P)H:quinone oxidoreductase n=1 Tax=Oleispirillum naphthae TaxID=2838853 RepID=UPI00308259A8
MTKILILYYSSYGHVEAMAQAAAEGVRAAGAEAVVKRVPELVPEDAARKAGIKLDQAAPVADPQELAEYDGFLFGTPTRFGNMAAEMKNFLDQTGGLWFAGKLIGKPAGAFVSTATQHGGQESTLLTFHTVLLHHGMVVVGLPYSAQGQMTMSEISGGTPYGASTLAAGDGSRQPSENELALMRFQAEHLAKIAAKLKA